MSLEASQRRDAQGHGAARRRTTQHIKDEAEAEAEAEAEVADSRLVATRLLSERYSNLVHSSKSIRSGATDVLRPQLNSRISRCLSEAFERCFLIRFMSGGRAFFSSAAAASPLTNEVLLLEILAATESNVQHSQCTVQYGARTST